MATIESLYNRFSSISDNLGKSLGVYLREEAIDVRGKIQEVTPKGKDGKLARSWRINSLASASGIIAGVRIFNPLSYASVLEFGLNPSEHIAHSWTRWYVYGDRKKSSKLTFSKGRIWSKAAVGGISTKVITPKYELQLARNIADLVVTML